MSLRVAGAAVLAWCLLSGTADAQEVGVAVEDLRTHNVTYEDGALSQEWLDQLDATVADLQDSAGYFKVVVLADDVSSYSDADAFADAVRTEIGGRGRVMVYAPTEVALSSNLDPTSLVDQAELTAAAQINDGSTLAVATADAATKLSSDISGTARSALDATEDSESGGGGGGGWGLLLLLLAPLVALVGFLMWTARKMRRQAEATSSQEIGAAEAKVRSAVDEVANNILDLSDRVDQPGAPPEAKAAFTQGAELFTTAQEMLESADTRTELEAAYPKVVEAGWQMDIATALLAGQPAPPQPDPEPLFPRVVVARPRSAGDATGVPVPAGADAGAPAARPEPHYRQSGASPWLTAAAMAAISVLSQRGMSVPQTRRPMDDGAFGNWSGGLPPVPSSSNQNRGFGFGRRGKESGRVVVPSGQGRGMGRRGMGRR